MPTSIVIVDDHPVVSHGLRAILEKEPSFSVTGVAPDAKSALKIIEDNKPDIIILDITLPEGDGISLIARILDVHGSAGIIMYTMHDTREYVFRAFRSGALGYVLKGDKIEEIREAVSSVRQQKLFLSSSLPGSLLQELIVGKSSLDSDLSELTPREYEVASSIARGMTPDQVAAALFISPRTVRVHRTNIMHKLSCKGVHELLLKLHRYFPC